MDLLEISYLNEVCFLSLNTDDKKYRMCLKMSQDDLKSELGRPFYEEIETQYSANPQTLSADNLSLYTNYIKDFLAWQTYFNYLKFANVEATPTGIRTFNDENSSIAGDIQMHSLEKNVLAEAKKKKYNMINYIKEVKANDSTKFPLYTSSCKEYMSFAITSIDKNSDTLIKVNKAIVTNE